MILAGIRIPMSAGMLAGPVRGVPATGRFIVPWSSLLGLTLISILMTSLASSCLAKPLEDLTTTNVEESMDGCDRVLWSTQETRGVHTLSTRCSEGYVSWQQPNGALRVSFRPPTSVPSNSLIETCFSVSTHLLKVIVSRELSAKEGNREVEGLEHLVMLDRRFPRTKTDICVRTTRPLTLFVEAQPGEVTASIGHVRLQYDVIVVNKNQEDSLEECRPCTEEELLVKVCSNDFVISGEMNDVHTSDAMKQTAIDVKIDRIYRQKMGHFESPSHHRRRRETSDDKSSKSKSNSKHQGSVIAPHKCGIRKGAGHFLFVGRIRLGKAILQCAPRVDEFNNIWNKAVQQGTNPCFLD